MGNEGKFCTECGTRRKKRVEETKTEEGIRKRIKEGRTQLDNYEDKIMCALDSMDIGWSMIRNPWRDAIHEAYDGLEKDDGAWYEWYEGWKETPLPKVERNRADSHYFMSKYHSLKYDLVILESKLDQPYSEEDIKEMETSLYFSDERLDFLKHEQDREVTRKSEMVFFEYLINDKKEEIKRLRELIRGKSEPYESLRSKNRLEGVPFKRNSEN